MGGTKGIVHVVVAEFGQLLAELLVVTLKNQPRRVRIRVARSTPRYEGGLIIKMSHLG